MAMSKIVSRYPLLLKAVEFQVFSMIRFSLATIFVTSLSFGPDHVMLQSHALVLKSLAITISPSKV